MSAITNVETFLDKWIGIKIKCIDSSHDITIQLENSELCREEWNIDVNGAPIQKCCAVHRLLGSALISTAVLAREVTDNNGDITDRYPIEIVYWTPEKKREVLRIVPWVRSNGYYEHVLDISFKDFKDRLSLGKGDPYEEDN